MELDESTQRMSSESQAGQHTRASSDLSNGHQRQASPILSYLGLGKDVLPDIHGEALLAALNDEQWSVRVAAVRKLEGLGEHAPLEPLLTALNDEKQAVRAAAAFVLGSLGERVPIEPLLTALHDPEWHVRTASVLALGKQSHRITAEPLLVVLSDEDEAVRAAAVWALGMLGERAPIVPLVGALSDSAWSVREAAALALGTLGSRIPPEPLLAARADEDSAVRTAAQQALEQTHPEIVAPPVVSTVATGPLEPEWVEKALTDLARSSSSTLDEKTIKPHRRERYPVGVRAARKRTRKVQPVRAKRSRLTSIAESMLVAAVIAGIALSWLLLSQKFNTTTATYFSYHRNSSMITQVVWSSPQDVTSGNAALIAFAGADGWLEVWNPQSNTLAATYGPFKQFAKVLSMNWVADGIRMAYLDTDGKIQLVQDSGSEPFMSLESPPGSSPLAAWSPDGTRIVVAFNNGNDGTAEVWDTTRNRLAKHASHMGAVTAIAWTRDGKTIATANNGGPGSGTIEEWDATTGQSLLPAAAGQQYISVGFRVVTMAWSPDGTRLAYTLENGDVDLRDRGDSDTRLNRDTPNAHTYPGMKAALAWSPDGRLLAMTMPSGLIQVRDSDSGNLDYSYQGHSQQISDLAWSPDGKRIVSVSIDGTVKVWGATST